MACWGMTSTMKHFRIPDALIVGFAAFVIGSSVFVDEDVASVVALSGPAFLVSPAFLAAIG